MENLLKIFKAFGDKNRIRIIKMLQKKPMCVCEITAVLELATSTVSKHLSILKEAEVIIDLKNGKWVDYYLNKSSNNIYLSGLLPLLLFWLEADKQIQQDIERAQKADRNELCGA